MTTKCPRCGCDRELYDATRKTMRSLLFLAVLGPALIIASTVVVTIQQRVMSVAPVDTRVESDGDASPGLRAGGKR